MTLNRDLFLAILAMDSYDRGSGSDLGLSDALGTGIGNATIRVVSNQNPNSLALAAGFYAIAYDTSGVAGLGAGTVISYRGTNFDPKGGLGSPAATDILNGWSLFSGVGPNSQAALAQEFFTAVTGSNFNSGPVTVGTNVILTGHSLGGGLAGYVGSQAVVTDTVVFDPIPYGVASWENALSTAYQAALNASGLTALGLVSLLAEELVPLTVAVTRTKTTQPHLVHSYQT
jgi:hypothetical protein